MAVWADRPGHAPADRLQPGLAGIPETMLWTLYARASEAKRAGGFLRHREAVPIFEALEFDFTRRFGAPSYLSIVLWRWASRLTCGSPHRHRRCARPWSDAGNVDDEANLISNFTAAMATPKIS